MIECVASVKSFDDGLLSQAYVYYFVITGKRIFWIEMQTVFPWNISTIFSAKNIKTDLNFTVLKSLAYVIPLIRSLFKSPV